MNRTFFIPPGTTPQQVNFPAGVSGRKGAAYFYPNQLVILSDEELAHIRSAVPGLAGRLVDASPPPATVREELVEQAETRSSETRARFVQRVWKAPDEE
jgi:hypothetical protein